MYLQITTKCNMTCGHCCYSCGKNGKHMARHVWQQALVWCAKHDEESIAIGGGEPTLHPDFFEILSECINRFSFVWMATNGSKTKIMWRLANIIDQEDFPEDGSEDYESHIFPKTSDQLMVELSTDYFHDPIDSKVQKYWENRTAAKSSGYGIRDVTKYGKGPMAQGRAKKTGSGWGEGCCCSDIFINPSGKIKACGCTKSPFIGDVWNGLEEKWEHHIQTDPTYCDTNCFFGKS